ncbi:MAG: arginase family protein [Gemmatimonadales bacterium]
MNIQILLVPYDTARRGWRAGLGPERLLQAGLVAHLLRQGHLVSDVQVIEDDPAEPPAEIRTAFELHRRLAPAVRAARAAGRFPLVLSGNCNSSVGTLSGLSPERRAIFWFDAHGDLNTPDTTETGFLDGTGLATNLGWCWHQVAASVAGFSPVGPETTFLLGARDLDPLELALLERVAIPIIPVAHIPERLPDLLARAPLDDTLGYVHFDVDVLDPGVGKPNRLPVPNGLTVQQVTGAIAAIRRRLPLGAAGVASYEPAFDSDGAIGRAVFAAIDAMVAGGA